MKLFGRKENETKKMSGQSGKPGQLQLPERIESFRRGSRWLSRENEYVSQKFLKERIQTFSDQRVQQNIMGHFVDSGAEIIRGEYVDRALDNYKDDFHLQPESYSLSGWDLARKQTATVGATVAVVGDKIQVVEIERFKMFDWNVVIEKIKIRQKKYHGRLIVDATGLGDVVVEQLRDYRPESFLFNASSKAELLTHLEMLHARGRIAYQRWELCDGEGKVWSLEDELRRARWDKKNDCDALMTLALAVWPLRARQRFTPAPRVGRV